MAEAYRLPEPTLDWQFDHPEYRRIYELLENVPTADLARWASEFTPHAHWRVRSDVIGAIMTHCLERLAIIVGIPNARYLSRAELLTALGNVPNLSQYVLPRAPSPPSLLAPPSPPRQRLLAITYPGPHTPPYENDCDHLNISPRSITVAIRENHLELIPELLRCRAPIGMALHVAAREMLLPVVHQLVEAGADVNAPAADDHTPLHAACGLYLPGHRRYLGGAGIVMYLLANGANPNMVERQGWTPLHCAVRIRNLPVMRMLVAAGADIDSRTNERVTPLICICASENIDIQVVRWLLNHGANPNLADSGGYTALMFVAMSPHVNIARLLIRAHADVNMRTDTTNESALGLAVIWHHHRMVAELLRAGADVNLICTESGDTPLIVACQEANTECVTYLLDRGADVNQTNDSDITPLIMLAMTSDDVYIGTLLINAGANVMARTVVGETAFTIATRHQFHYLATLIAAHEH